MSAAAVAIGENEVAQLSLATHDVEHINPIVSVTVDNSTRTDDHLSVPGSSKFRRPPTRIWEILQSLNRIENSFDQKFRRALVV